MAAKDITGTLRKVTLDGPSYDVMGDINVTIMGSRFENEGIPTSGRTIKKMTRRSQTIESVTLACNLDEFEALRELDERQENFSMSITLAGGDTVRSSGFIVFENWESETGTATIKMEPAEGNQWRIFTG